MKKLNLLVKSWIFSLTFGPSQPLPPSKLRLISGLGSVESFSESLITLWMTTSQQLKIRWTSVRQWSFLRPYPARHRATGGQRQTRAGTRSVRIQREEAWTNHRAFLALREPGTVGVAYLYPPSGDRAYRKLSPALLNQATRDLVRRYAPQGWLDD